MTKVNRTFEGGKFTFALGDEVLVLNLDDFESGAQVLKAAKEWAKEIDPKAVVK